MAAAIRYRLNPHWTLATARAGGGTEMLKKIAERARSEAGFTMVELLIVVVIIGILAAIALPGFLNKRGKADDAHMKVQTKTMHTALEACATDNNSSYANCNITALNNIESTIPTSGTLVTSTATTWVVRSQASASTGNYYWIQNFGGGVIAHLCWLGSANAGGCNIGTRSPAVGLVGTW